MKRETKQREAQAVGRSAPTACSARPSLNPQNIDDDAWYYEYRKRIDVVVYVTARDGLKYARTVRISWRKLEKSLMRCKPNPQISRDGGEEKK